ncbi:MAG: hypothetical protein BRC29_05350 [Nanohaloarchaea archaeon SW_7_43_1]|nr:MAG: hypothetical protein BRC29_05350 [Nanohaloarchaea archaeon SW_7_43_1]
MVGIKRSSVIFLASLVLVLVATNLAGSERLLITDFSSNYSDSSKAGDVRFNASLRNNVVEKESPGVIRMSLQNKGMDKVFEFPGFPPFGAVYVDDSFGSYAFSLWHENYTNTGYVGVQGGSVVGNPIGLLKEWEEGEARTVDYKLLQNHAKLDRESLPKPGDYAISDTIDYRTNNSSEQLRYSINFTIERYSWLDQVMY